MRLTSPSVSVIMPVFNVAAYVEEAVRSILEKTFSAFELILIDDGSSDETPAILDRLAGRDARIRLVHQTNAGLVAALNLGLSLARGRYVARMDADDRAYPERLAEQFAFLEKHPEVAVLGGSARLMDRAGRMIGQWRLPTTDLDLKALLRSGASPFIHSTVMLRRDVLAAAGGYAAGPYLDAENFELWNRLSRTQNLANLPAILLDYRVHGQSVSWTPGGGAATEKHRGLGRKSRERRRAPSVSGAGFHASGVAIAGGLPGGGAEASPGCGRGTWIRFERPGLEVAVRALYRHLRCRSALANVVVVPRPGRFDWRGSAGPAF